MKTVFFDTNVMIDIIGRRQQFCRPSLQIMSLADRGILRVCVSAMSYATASFILSRDNKQMDIVGEFAKLPRLPRRQLLIPTPLTTASVPSSTTSRMPCSISLPCARVSITLSRATRRTSRQHRFPFSSRRSLLITY